MYVKIKKLTDEALLREACDATRKPGLKPSTASLSNLYKCLHSPVRTQMFWVEMYEIPSYVSTHLVRHKIGVEHFVESNRDDRLGAMPEGSSLLYKGVTADYFDEYFEYDDGKLYWRKKTSNKSLSSVGEEAGHISVAGRAVVTLHKKRFYRAIVIFMMHYRFKPPMVDHINGNTLDDRVENLRAATSSQNRVNQTTWSNSTGFKGVSLVGKTGRFQAAIKPMGGGDSIYLGTFDTAKEAALAYDAASLKYFGEFSALNFPDKDRPVFRNTLVKHSMLINSQALISISRARLCYNADIKTVSLISRLKKAVREVDQALAENMAPHCVEKGYCPELRECKSGVVKVLMSYKDNWMVQERARVNTEIMKAVDEPYRWVNP